MVSGLLAAKHDTDGKDETTTKALSHVSERIRQSGKAQNACFYGFQTVTVALPYGNCP